MLMLGYTKLRCLEMHQNKVQLPNLIFNFFKIQKSQNKPNNLKIKYSILQFRYKLKLKKLLRRNNKILRNNKINKLERINNRKNQQVYSDFHKTGQVFLEMALVYLLIMLEDLICSQEITYLQRETQFPKKAHNQNQLQVFLELHKVFLTLLIMGYLLLKSRLTNPRLLK